MDVEVDVEKKERDRKLAEWEEKKLNISSARHLSSSTSLKTLLQDKFFKIRTVTR